MLDNLKTYTLAALMLVAAPAPAAWAADSDAYQFMHANEPPIPAGDGRFYFYREGGMMGAAVQAHAAINGEDIGDRLGPNRYFYVDRPAGTYEISAETEKKEAVTATIAPGQSLYIRFEVQMGFFIGHVSPSIIDPQQALTEIKDCRDRQPAEAAPAAPAAPAEPTAPAAPAPPDTSTPH